MSKRLNALRPRWRTGAAKPEVEGGPGFAVGRGGWVGRQNGGVDVTARVRGFSGRRQGLVGVLGEGGVLGALERVVGVYSAQPSGPLTLAARVAAFDPAEFVELERESRRIVRVPAMRGSVHIVPTAEVGRIMAATGFPRNKFAWHLRPADLDWDGYERCLAEAVELLQEPLASAQLRKETGWSSARARAVLQLGTADRTLVRVAGDGLRSNALRYVATVAWLGAPIEEHDPDESLVWLAGEYLRAFGPAQVDDFAWWTSCGRKRAEAAFARLDTVEVAPGLLLAAADVDEFEATEPIGPDHVDVLPVWDAYTMGYPSTGRSRLGPPEVLDRLYDDAGNGLGVVLAGGHAVGSWNSRFVGRTMQVDLEPLAHWRAAVRLQVERRLADLAALLGAANLDIVPISGGPRRPVGGKGNRRSYVP